MQSRERSQSEPTTATYGDHRRSISSHKKAFIELHFQCTGFFGRSSMRWLHTFNFTTKAVKLASQVLILTADIAQNSIFLRTRRVNQNLSMAFSEYAHSAIRSVVFLLSFEQSVRFLSIDFPRRSDMQDDPWATQDVPRRSCSYAVDRFHVWALRFRLATFSRKEQKTAFPIEAEKLSRILPYSIRGTIRMCYGRWKAIVWNPAKENTVTPGDASKAMNTWLSWESCCRTSCGRRSERRRRCSSNWLVVD